MRMSGIAWLLLSSVATLAQEAVEITSEPRHHLVLENQYVRVFDVIVEPKGSTLLHHHNLDYLFVTLGDSDVVSARPGEKPVRFLLKDGETRFATGNFSHAAVNRSARPFHKITIELRKKSRAVRACKESCSATLPCFSGVGAACPTVERRIASDQWALSLMTMPSLGAFERSHHDGPYLIIALSDLEFAQRSGGSISRSRMAAGDCVWLAPATGFGIANTAAHPARFLTLEFRSEKQM